jgi:hypothetical protein
MCHYCDINADLVTGNVIYPHRSDLSTLFFYKCSSCDAYVGTHKIPVNGVYMPFGILANASLRKAKSRVHKTFDMLWKDCGMKRKESYKWLSEAMNLSKNECHIGMFNEELCKKASTLSANKVSQLLSEDMDKI